MILSFTDRMPLRPTPSPRPQLDRSAPPEHVVLLAVLAPKARYAVEVKLMASAKQLAELLPVDRVALRLPILLQNDVNACTPVRRRAFSLEADVSDTVVMAHQLGYVLSAVYQFAEIQLDIEGNRHVYHADWQPSGVVVRFHEWFPLSA